MAETKFKNKIKAEAELELSQLNANTVPVLNANKEVVSSAVTSTEISYVSGVVGPIQTQINNANTALSDHLVDAVDAHDASAISNIPSGNLAATDIQSAVNELQSDIDTRALDSAVIKKDGSVVFTANQSMGNFSLTDVADPTAPQQAATKAYVDAVAQGLNIKSSVLVATVAALPAVTAAGSQVGKSLTADANGALSIDGVSSFIDVDNDGGSISPTEPIGTRASRVLIKDQANAVDNGIYHVKDKGSVGTPFILVRAVDTDGSPAAEVESVFLFVREGTVNADSGWTLITNSPVVDTNPLTFTQFSGAGSIEAGAALDKSGNTLNVLVDGQGIEIVSDQLSIELDGTTLAKSASGLKLNDTAVTPGSYGSASQTSTISVDQQGRITSASQQNIAITASQVTDFTEAAQDAVGTILLDTASIDFTYDDATPNISAVVLPAGVDHDQLANFVATEHVDHSAVQIQTVADSGLTGGGDITVSRSLSVDINGTTLETVIDDADKVLIWDNSALALKSITRANFLGGAIPQTTDDLPEGVTNLYYTDERVDDRVAALLLEGAGIDLTYNDVANSLTIASTITQYTDELAQDAVGNILVDSPSIDFTYDDVANTITAVVLPAGVDHDALQNFVANEHIDHSAVQIATAADSGLSGGGDITATRNLTVDITGTSLHSGVLADNDEVLVWDVSLGALRKATKAQVLGGALTSPGDLSEDSISIANNVAIPTNIANFAFSNSVVRSFKALVSVEIDATADLYESFEILGIQKSAGWDISIMSTGDTSGVNLSITAAGQMQYTSANQAGFVSGLIKFRAYTTSF